MIALSETSEKTKHKIISEERAVKYQNCPEKVVNG